MQDATKEDSFAREERGTTHRFRDGIHRQCRGIARTFFNLDQESCTSKVAEQQGLLTIAPVSLPKLFSVTLCVSLATEDLIIEYPKVVYLPYNSCH